MKYLQFIFTLLLISIISFYGYSQSVEGHPFSDNQVLRSTEKTELSGKSVVLHDAATLDSIINDGMEKYHFPGLSASIIVNNQIHWQKSYGYADIAENRLVTDSTIFYLASVSKTVTGTAIMQLWEDGLFELDDDVNDYLPFQVHNPSHPDDSITFRMLLTHTSSINDNFSVINTLNIWGEDSPIALEDYLINYLTTEGDYYYTENYNAYAPGTQFSYSGVGASLLGYLVEEIADTSLEQYCHDSIFGPLSMNETSWFLTNLDSNNLAIPYLYAINYMPYGQSGHPGYPSKQLRSSMIQLTRFLMAFMQNGQIDDIRILNGTTVDMMTSHQYQAPAYGMGLIWQLVDVDIPGIGIRTTCGHLGSWYGASALIGYSVEPNENVGVVVLANSRSDNGIIDVWTQLMSYGIITGIEEEKFNLPNTFALFQNYPNPFNPSTNIEFTLPKTEFVTLKVYNILGEQVATLLNKKLQTGLHSYQFDGSNLASGVYLYRIEAGEYQDVKKMVLLR